MIECAQRWIRRRDPENGIAGRLHRITWFRNHQHAAHAELGHADVGAIEVGKHVDEDQVGNEAAGDARPRAERDVLGRMDAGVHWVISMFRGVGEALFDDRQLTSYSAARVAAGEWPGTVRGVTTRRDKFGEARGGYSLIQRRGAD